jgi:hypothetical protein
VCSELFLRNLEIDRKIGLIRDIIYYIESDRRDELHDIEIEEFRELKEEVGIWTTIARPPITGEITNSGLLFTFDWNYALREIYRKKIRVKVLHKTMIAVPGQITYEYYHFPYTALTNFNSNKYPRFVCDKDNNLYNVLYLRRSKKYRLTNVDNLKKRFKVNKTELETKYYDV